MCEYVTAITRAENEQFSQGEQYILYSYYVIISKMEVDFIVLWRILLGLCSVLFFMFIVFAIVSALKGSVIFKNKMKAISTYLILAIMFAFIGLNTHSNLRPLELITLPENKSTSVDLKMDRSIYQVKLDNKIDIQKAKHVECWTVKEEPQNKQVQSEASTSNNKKEKIIGDKDSKIYHVPGSTYYQKELQKLSNNEYFDTVQDAEKAGYRAPKN